MNLVLKEKIKEADNAYSFFFERPEGFEFKAGQYIYITLPKLNYPDQRGDTRHFTISSSPSDKDLRITTRIRQESGYKKTLYELETNTILEARGPFGIIDLESDIDKTSVYIAGGIGITPFISKIRNDFDKTIKKDTNDNIINLEKYLIYSNSSDDFVFKDEISNLIENGLNLKVCYVNTAKESRINNEKMLKIIKDWNLNIKKLVFYVVGPKEFVDGLEEILLNIGVEVDNIKTEKFTGY